MCYARLIPSLYPSRRQYLQSRDLRREAEEKLPQYKTILRSAEAELDRLRVTGIPCRAFLDNDTDSPEVIQVTRQCWNHVFKHPVKRQTKLEKLERALCLPLALKLLARTTTYQGVSRETDRGGNRYLAFEIVGYVRGNRVKVVIRRQEKHTNAKKVLLSWWQMSSAPKKPRAEA